MTEENVSTKETMQQLVNRVVQLHSESTSYQNMLTEERRYSPVHSGFILYIQSASQRPSSEFDVDSVRNHCCISVFMLHSS